MKDILKELGLEGAISQSAAPAFHGTFAGEWLEHGETKTLASISPIDNAVLGSVTLTTSAGYEAVVQAASLNFARWQMTPAPVRGEVIREIAHEFRRLKKPLAKLITLEMGKILAEAEGEVQEVIDIADFAVGLSRQLYGKTMHSERPRHRMYEHWHPLGNIGVITAFNFPVAVWSWNALIAAVCGNSVVWKTSELTPLTAIATTQICSAITKKHGFPGLFTLISGDGPGLGRQLAADTRFPLISATGSCAMGRSVGEVVAKRLGRSLLELGGNNAIIVLKDANLDLAVRAVVFGAVGTAGQRCTTTRRLLVEESIVDELSKRLIAAYQQVRIGNPLEPTTLIGPLIHQRAVDAYCHALECAEKEGGKILCGGKIQANSPSPFYVQPTIIRANENMAICQEETFAPILYLIPIRDLDHGIAVQNNVPQGLSSSLFTNNIMLAEKFLSHLGSDCGIANINIGTSGAEIGGAFGGEKDTGGGREAGSDSWKAYMRRQTTTINWGGDLPLAQGIQFG